MGIKILSNYPIKQFPGVTIPNVEMTFKGEFRQEKRDNQYHLSTVCYIFNNPEHENPFEIVPFYLIVNECPQYPLNVLYSEFKNQRLQGLDFEDN